MKKNYPALAGIILTALILRMIALKQSLWLDESIEVLAVKNNSFHSLITTYSLGDFHPPLFHLILKFWDGIFGYGETASRFPSVIFGVLTVVIIYFIGKKLISEKAGVIAALFLALNPLAVYYSQEARMYMAAAFFVSAAFLFFLRKNWLWFIVFFTLAIYTDYVPYFMFPVFFLLASDKKHFIKLLVILAVLQLPWIPFFLKQLHIGTGAAAAAPGWGEIVGGFSFKALPLTWLKFITGRVTIVDKYLYALIFGSLSAVYIYIALHYRRRELWIWLLAPTVLGFIFSLILPVYSYFRFLFVVPAFTLILAGAAEKNRVFAAVVALVSLGSLLVFDVNPGFWRENWRGFTEYVREDPGIIAMPSLAQADPIYYYDPTLVVEDKNNFQPTGRNIYLLRYVQEAFDPQDRLRKSLEAHGYKFTAQKNFNGVVVWKYGL